MIKVTYNITIAYIYRTLIGSHGTTAAWWFRCVKSFRLFTKKLKNACKIHVSIIDVFSFKLIFTQLQKWWCVSRNRGLYGRHGPKYQVLTVQWNRTSTNLYLYNKIINCNMALLWWFQMLWRVIPHYTSRSSRMKCSQERNLPFYMHIYLFFIMNYTDLYNGLT